ncbi:hypothetical protein AB0425_17405 [Actinosynnema sp. NPDC051121]
MTTLVLDSTIYPLPVHPVWGRALTVLGDQPVWPVAGGADDDEDDGIDLEDPGSGAGGSDGGGRRDFLDDEPDDDDDPSGDDADTKADSKPDSKAKPADEAKARTPEDWARLEKALADERGLRKRREGQIAEMRKERRAAEATGDDDEAERLRKAEEAAAARYKPVAVKAAAKAALLEANFQKPTEERVKKIIKRLDLEEIDIDDDGDVIGLQDQIDQLVADFPELFTAPAEAVTTTTTTKPRAKGKLSPAGKKDTEPTFATTGDRIAAQVRGEA